MLLDDVKELPVDKWARKFVIPHYAKRAKDAAPQARCYVFDREASRKLGEFIASCPDVIADQLEFAVEPYPVTYIEVDIDAVIDGTGYSKLPKGDDADWKVGFLKVGLYVFVFVSNPRYPTAMMACFGFAYLENNTRTFEPGMEEHAAAHMLGATYNHLSPPRRQKFLGRYAQTYYGPDELKSTAMREILDGHAGEVRTYAAALLLLHQKKGISLSEKAAHRAMYRGKSRPFMAHNVVTITLDGPVEIRRALTSGSGETRRAHEVPAHYAHRYGTRSCEHIWVKRENEENHWDCSKCGRFRYLRRDHIRGDASKGFVKKSYNVVTERSK